MRLSTTILAAALVAASLSSTAPATAGDRPTLFQLFQPRAAHCLKLTKRSCPDRHVRSEGSSDSGSGTSASNAAPAANPPANQPAGPGSSGGGSSPAPQTTPPTTPAPGAEMGGLLGHYMHFF